MSCPPAFAEQECRYTYCMHDKESRVVQSPILEITDGARTFLFGLKYLSELLALEILWLSPVAVSRLINQCGDSGARNMSIAPVSNISVRKQMLSLVQSRYRLSSAVRRMPREMNTLLIQRRAGL